MADTPDRSPTDPSGAADPAVFLPFVSPFTLVLVAAAVAATLVLGAPWWLAALIGLAVYGARVGLGIRSARYARTRRERIDPFALREPWRFHVRDALSARNRFLDMLDDAGSGPLRDRLIELGADLDRAIDEVWRTARRAQEVSDARRSIDRARLERELTRITEDGGPLGEVDEARVASLQAQLGSADRLQATLDHTTDRLAVLDARLDETVVRMVELGTRTNDPGRFDPFRGDLDDLVLDLEALRQGLDATDGRS